MVSRPKDKQEIAAIILSIMVAFFLWVYVTSEKNPMQTKVIDNIPVALTNIEAITQSDLALMPGQVFSASLTVTGRALDVYNTTASDFRIEADMATSLKKGTNAMPVDIKVMPKNVSIVGTKAKPFINVRLDELAEKTIPVMVNIRGKVSEGYGYTKPLVRPTEVTVSGPKSFVSLVYGAIGQVDISGNYSNISGSVPLKPADKDGNPVNNLTLDPKYVDVNVSVKPSKEVPIKIVTVGEMKGARMVKDIKSKTDSVVIIGDRKYIDKIDYIQTEPFDLSTVKSNTTGELYLNIPPGIKILGDINSIKVNFVVENKTDKTITIPISLMNQSEDFSYTVNPSKIDVSITGPSSTIDSLNEGNMTAVIDLTGLTEGTKVMDVQVSKPDGITIKSITPDKASVTVVKK